MYLDGWKAQLLGVMLDWSNRDDKISVIGRSDIIDENGDDDEEDEEEDDDDDGSGNEMAVVY